MSNSPTKNNSVNLPLFDDFLLHLKVNNYSDETIYNYERDLNILKLYLDQENVSFNNINKKIVDRYKAWLNSDDREVLSDKEIRLESLSASSINRMLSTFRSYLKYLVDMDKSVPIPPDGVNLIKTPRKHPRVAELEDLIRLVESPSKFEEDELVALRNRAALEVLFSTGMRISELLNLNRDRIDESGKIFVRGKGKKERFVYLTPRAEKHLNAYLDTRDDAVDAVFVPYAGPNVNDPQRRLSTNYLQAKIKEYRERLQINVPTSAHSLRHGFATYLAESGANPAAIQILLGHESLETTTRYVHASDRYAEETHKEYHPLSN